MHYIRTYDSNDPFLIQFSYWNVHTPTVGREDLVKMYEDMGVEGKQAEFAAQVSSVDESVGRILKVIKEKKLEENTCVLFTSDQGSFYPNTPLKGTKAVGTALYEGSARIPFLVKCPGITKSGLQVKEHVSTLDIFPTLLEIAGQDLSGYNELDGSSLMELFTED